MYILEKVNTEHSYMSAPIFTEAALFNVIYNFSFLNYLQTIPKINKKYLLQTSCKTLISLTILIPSSKLTKNNKIQLSLLHTHILLLGVTVL